MKAIIMRNYFLSIILIYVNIQIYFCNEIIGKNETVDEEDSEENILRMMQSRASPFRNIANMGLYYSQNKPNPSSGSVVAYGKLWLTKNVNKDGSLIYSVIENVSGATIFNLYKADLTNQTTFQNPLKLNLGAENINSYPVVNIYSSNLIMLAQSLDNEFDEFLCLLPKNPLR